MPWAHENQRSEWLNHIWCCFIWLCLWLFHIEVTMNFNDNLNTFFPRSIWLTRIYVGVRVQDSVNSLSEKQSEQIRLVLTRIIYCASGLGDLDQAWDHESGMAASGLGDLDQAGEWHGRMTSSFSCSFLKLQRISSWATRSVGKSTLSPDSFTARPLHDKMSCSLFKQ